MLEELECDVSNADAPTAAITMTTITTITATVLEIDRLLLTYKLRICHLSEIIKQIARISTQQISFFDVISQLIITTIFS